MEQQKHQEHERIQTVMFLRHGVAKHNLLDPITGRPPNLHDPALWDPPLVDRGIHQALAVREHLLRYYNNNNNNNKVVELVVASPLTRCLQTAHLVFFPGYLYDSQQPPPPIICLEQVREAFGMHYPDKRRDKSLLQRHWPFVHFQPEMTDRDDAWSETSRETLEDVTRRVAEFFHWLVQREESTIFVVSHGVWIESCLDAYFPEILQNGLRVHNCDCYVGEVVSSHLGTFLRLQNVRRI